MRAAGHVLCIDEIMSYSKKCKTEKLYKCSIAAFQQVLMTGAAGLQHWFAGLLSLHSAVMLRITIIY